MRVSVPGLGDSSVLVSIDFVCASRVCAINYEEHTLVDAAPGAPTIGGGAPPMASHASALRSRLGNPANANRGVASRTPRAPVIERAHEPSGPRLIQPRVDPAQPPAAARPRTLPPQPMPPRAATQVRTSPPQPVAQEPVPFTAPPPPPMRGAPSVFLGEPLLPERANDTRYYPGLVNDLELDEPPKRGWQPWMNYAAAGLALFGLGLLTRSFVFGPDTHRAVIDTTPSDARVQIDGQLVTGSGNPRLREGLIAGDHVLLVEREGYVAHRQVFSISEPGDRRIVVSLDEERKPEPEPEPALNAAAEPEPAAPVVAVPETPLSKRELAKQRRSEARAARLANRAERAATHSARDSAADGGGDSDSGGSVKEHSRSGGGTAILKLNSSPWSEVYIDKKHVGHTPVLGLPITAGQHSIELTNPALGMSKKFRIKLKAGETLTRIEKLGS